MSKQGQEAAEMRMGMRVTALEKEVTNLEWLMAVYTVILIVLIVAVLT